MEQHNTLFHELWIQAEWVGICMELLVLGCVKTFDEVSASTSIYNMVWKLTKGSV